MADEDLLIQTICNGLKKYYQLLGREYDALFFMFCDENGLDDEGLAEDLDLAGKELEACLVVDFIDDDFPLRDEIADELERKQFILDIIIRCTNPSATFKPAIPRCVCLSSIHHKFIFLQYT